MVLTKIDRWPSLSQLGICSVVREHKITRKIKERGLGGPWKAGEHSPHYADHRGGNLQDREFAGLERQDGEQEETYHETDGGAQITCAEDEHTVPPTHYTQPMLVCLSSSIGYHVNKHGGNESSRRRNCSLITWITQQCTGGSGDRRVTRQKKKLTSKEALFFFPSSSCRQWGPRTFIVSR